MTTTIVIITLVFLLAIYFYNSLVRSKNEVENASGSIHVMLKNRYDLIPNLVETVKSYMTYEADVLNKLTSMRSMTKNKKLTEDEKLNLDKEIGKAMQDIMISVENYPELKASTNFLQLQESWTDIEDRISASRRFYNHAVTEYNVAIKSFPKNMIASIMGYKSKAVFEIPEQEQQPLNAKGFFNN